MKLRVADPSCWLCKWAAGIALVIIPAASACCFMQLAIREAVERFIDLDCEGQVLATKPPPP